MPDDAKPTAATTTLTPYLIVRGAAPALDFYARAFGAEEVMRLAEPSGRIGHAELNIAGWRLMLADEYPEHGILGPQSLGGASGSLHLQVADVDAVVARAVAAGAELVRPVNDEFYGERIGKLRDPFGHLWHVGTQIEAVSPDEMQRRFDAMPAPAEGTDESAAPAAPVQPPAAPPGYHSVTVYLVNERAGELVDWVKQALGAVENFRSTGTGSGGGIHAEVTLGDSKVMIGGGPGTKGGDRTAMIYLYVADLEATYRRALAAGVADSKPPADQPYGDRNAMVQDPFGNTWYLASPIKR
jgi:PhnB protein